MPRAITIAAILTIFALGFPTQSIADHHGSINKNVQKQLDDLERQTNPNIGKTAPEPKMPEPKDPPEPKGASND